jgi:hypothetical protein
MELKDYQNWGPLVLWSPVGTVQLDQSAGSWMVGSPSFQALAPVNRMEVTRSPCCTPGELSSLLSAELWAAHNTQCGLALNVLLALKKGPERGSHPTPNSYKGTALAWSPVRLWVARTKM